MLPRPGTLLCNRLTILIEPSLRLNNSGAQGILRHRRDIHAIGAPRRRGRRRARDSSGVWRIHGSCASSMHIAEPKSAASQGVDGPDRSHHEGNGAGNPSPGWERGRGEGPPLIVEARRSRCASLPQGQALIRRSAPPSPIREKGRGVADRAKGAKPFSPRGRRWHGVAVTDEGRRCAPSSLPDVRPRGEKEANLSPPLLPRTTVQPPHSRGAAIRRCAVGGDGGGACGWSHDPLPGGCGNRPGDTTVPARGARWKAWRQGACDPERDEAMSRTGVEASRQRTAAPYKRGPQSQIADRRSATGRADGGSIHPRRSLAQWLRPDTLAPRGAPLPLAEPPPRASASGNLARVSKGRLTGYRAEFHRPFVADVMSAIMARIRTCPAGTPAAGLSVSPRSARRARRAPDRTGRPAPAPGESRRARPDRRAGPGSPCGSWRGR